MTCIPKLSETTITLNGSNVTWAMAHLYLRGMQWRCLIELHRLVKAEAGHKVPGSNSGVSKRTEVELPLPKRVQNSFWIFLGSGFGILFGFLSWYHLPCIYNSLELECVILHRICYIWPCSPSILHGICHVLALQPLICMVYLLHFGTSNVHVDFLRVSLGFFI